MAQIETNYLEPLPFPFDLLISTMEILIADGDIQTARQLSSTCFGLRARTEVHLFRTIHLRTIYQSTNHFHNFPPPVCQCTGNREFEIPAMEANPNLSSRSFYRFSHILDGNPELARYVKTLKIMVAKEHLTDPHIPRILDQLQNVEHLDWHLYGQMPLPWEILPISFRMSLGAVARNISKLTLTKINIPLQILLSSCPNISHLVLQRCDGVQMPPVPPHRFSASGAQLRVLELDSRSLPLFSQALDNAALHNTSIIDITQVHTVETTLFNSPDQILAEKLFQSFDKLEHLSCTTHVAGGCDAALRVLKASSFMTLRTLNSTCIKYGVPVNRDPFLGLCNGLRRFPEDNRLEIIIVSFSYDSAFISEGPDWDGFDGVVTLRFPRLRLFSVRVSMRCNAAREKGLEDAFCTLSRAYFQRIQSREDLEFEFRFTID